MFGKCVYTIIEYDSPCVHVFLAHHPCVQKTHNPCVQTKTYDRKRKRIDTPYLCANPNHEHAKCSALCHLTSSFWMEPLTINKHRVESPPVFVNESLGHVHIICGVQARLGQSLAHTHVCLLQHCVAIPWI